MYLSKIVLDRRLTPLPDLATLFAQGHPGHALAWQAFSRSADQERDFIFREEWEGDRFILWAVSSQAPGDWDGRLSVESMEYTPALSEGQRVGFKLRANATIAVKEPGAKRGKRHDVVMHAKQSLTPEQRQKLSSQEIIHQAGTSWLARKGESGGFLFDEGSVLVEGYRQHAFRKTPETRREVRFSTLDFDGILTITDPTRFTQTLYAGLGNTKAYGNGLMLVRNIT